MARLFVAVVPPPEVLDLVAGLPRVERRGVRWTTRDQWHVTLRFLGEADPDEARDALAGVRAPACEAVLGPRVGRLGSHVLVVPVQGLDVVAADVVACTAHLGKPPDSRPFFGHLTLARLKGSPACGLTDAEVRARWPVSSVALVESHLHPTGARYEIVVDVPLG